MTGCPNGCARPYNCRHRPGRPLGDPQRGRHARARAPTRSSSAAGRIGDRLNVEFKDYVPFDRVVAELVPVFARFKAERLDGETFGDFCDRIGVEELAGAASPA